MFVHRGLCDRCGQCGSALSVDVPQRLVEGRFRWSEYCDCTCCGSRLLIDGHGLLPHDLRAQILAAGWWLLVVDEASSVAVTGVLKTALFARRRPAAPARAAAADAGAALCRR
jgi:hypothetical protein